MSGPRSGDKGWVNDCGVPREGVYSDAYHKGFDPTSTRLTFEVHDASCDEWDVVHDNELDAVIDAMAEKRGYITELLREVDQEAGWLAELADRAIELTKKTR